MADVVSKTKQSQKILVTGGAGFIGSHVCEALIAKGYGVAALDNFDPYYDPSQKRRNLENLKGEKNFGLIEGDIGDEELLEKLFDEAKFDGVVHLAAKGGVRASIENPSEYVEVNIGGTTKLLDKCRKFEVGQFVFASSSSVYGDRKEGPFAETDQTDKQVSPYAATKKAGELMCGTYANLFGIKTAVLRLFTVYGPRNRPGMACSNFASAMLSDHRIVKYGEGFTGRDYTYIDDVVEGILAVIEKSVDNEVINLGNSHPVTLNNLIEVFEKVVGVEARIDQQELQAGDVELTYADIGKAKRLLGWEPKTDLETGIEKLVGWYRKQG